MGLLSTFLPSLNPVDVVVSLDLRDAFFPSYPSTFSGSSGVVFRDKFYRFKALPFGLRPAPRFSREIFDGHGASSKTGSSSFRFFGRLSLGREVGGSAVGFFAGSVQHDSRSLVSHRLGDFRIRPDSHSVFSRSST